MIREKTIKYFLPRTAVVCLCVCFMFVSNSLGDDVASAPKMPGHWKVITDIQVPAGQRNAISFKLGADLTSLRNTTYDVNGKSVKINTITATDSGNAEKVMAKLKSIKSEKALLRKNLIIYEFVGQNDVLPFIAEGRRYLESM